MRSHIFTEFYHFFMESCFWLQVQKKHVLSNISRCNLFFILSVFIGQRIYEITFQQFMKRRSPFCVPYVVIHILVIITWNHISNQFMREKGDLNALNVMLNFPKNLVWEHILNVCMKVCTLYLVPYKSCVSKNKLYKKN